MFADVLISIVCRMCCVFRLDHKFLQVAKKLLNASNFYGLDWHLHRFAVFVKIRGVNPPKSMTQPSPFLHPPSLLLFFLFFPFSFPSLPFLSLPLEVGPPQIQLGGLGSAVTSPAGSGAEAQPKSDLVHFSLKIWHLVARILIISWESTDQI